MGVTTNRALRYPEPTDQRKEGANAIKALAQDVDAQLPGLPNTLWITPTFLNGWTSYGGWPCKYRRWSGEVIIRGMVIPPAGGGGGLDIFALGPGFRTLLGHNQMFTCSDANRSATPTYVMPDGRIYPLAAVSTSWFAIDGIRYIQEG